MQSGIVHLDIRYDDQKRLQREFDDKRIRYGFNKKTKEFQVWYCPASSYPYLISTVVNVCHAIRILNHRRKYDQMRARDLLQSIDDHNNKLTQGLQDDAMLEVKSQLKNVACGKRFYT